MKKSCAELKQMARGQLNGRFGAPIGVTVIFLLISFGLSSLCTALFGNYGSINAITGSVVFNATQGILYLVFYVVMLLLLSVISAGMQKFYLNFVRNEEYKAGNLFYAFSHHPDRIIVAAFLILLLTIGPGVILTLLLLLLPESTLLILTLMLLLIVYYVFMVIVILSFSLTMYLLVDYSDLSAIEAIQESVRLMKGNKGRMFYISLSFIGWSILCAFTCGIGSLWLYPYIYTTQAYFYLDVTGELDKKADIAYQQGNSPYPDSGNGFQNSYDSSQDPYNRYQNPADTYYQPPTDNGSQNTNDNPYRESPDAENNDMKDSLDENK